MDITSLGAFGEFVGGMAVIASLVFVGFQLRGSNHLARASAELEMGRMNMDYYRLLAEGEAGANYIKCFFSPDDAGPEERMRFVCSQGMWIHIVQAMYRQNQRGLLSDASWTPLSRTLAKLLDESPIIQEAWEQNGLFLTDDFRAFVNQLRASPGRDIDWAVPESLRPKGGQ